MFSRRRAASNPASKQPPSASASLAATKAFLRDRDSNPTLSSAAAAAALRAHVAPPTRVGETVTKRMVRKGSTSSHGSGSIQGGGLRRQSSSGSMTERTFRAPSPSRSSPAHHDAPPVPSVPKEISNANGLHRRASSLDPTTRDTSPGPRGGGRGVSLDRGVTATPGRGQRVASLSQVPEAINFSRPISPQQNTSPRSPPVGRGQSGWFGGPVINPDVTFRGASKPQAKANHGVSAADLHNVQQNIQNAVDRPVKKTQTSHGVEGTRLATGSMRAKPSGSEVQPRHVQQAQLIRPKFPQSVDPNSPDAVYDPSTRSFIRKQDAMAQHRAFEDELNEPHQHFLEHHTIPEPIPQRVPQRQSAPVQPVHSSGPQQSHGRRTESPVRHHQREEQHAPYVEASTETDDIEDQFSSSQPSQPQAEAVLARQQSEDLAPIDVHPPATTHASHEDQADEHPASPTSPKIPSNQDGPYPRLATPVTEAATTTHAGRVRGNAKATERNQSLSPPRYAHFAPVAVEFPNGVKHQPPPRSVSPVKSALKSSPSVSRRNSSPIANNGRVVSVGAPSEPSDTMSDDGQKKKKKNVRVSFDADSVIVGTSAYAEADTPTSPTGLSASKWSTASEEQDEDDFMKPRPVLPSFGSIRDKNRRRSQDDTPEKVTETVPSSMSTSIASIGEPLEASSDHALGGILTQDFAKKKEIQPAFDEPLPPEVTSVEGTGYVSDSSESTFNEPDAHVIEEKVEFVQRKEDEGMEFARSTPEPEPKTLTTDVENRTPTPAQAPAMEVPIISIQMPSPSPNEKPEPKFPSHFVPGGWDEEESDQEANVEKVSRVQPIVTISKPTETKEKISEPEPVSQPQPDESSDESDSSSIYSDAYEDLSEAEDGGFGSIDAVVESPVVDVPSGLMFSKYADRSQNEHVKSSLQNEVHNGGTTAEAPSSSVAKNITQQHLEEPKEAEEEHRGEPAVIKPTSSVPTVHQKPRAERKAPIESKASAQPKSNLKSSGQTSQPVQSSTQPRKSALKAAASQPAAPPGPQLRKSMRDTAAVIGSSEPQTMRKSMRSGTATSSTEPRMRKSMRTSEAMGTSTAPSGLGLAASRHSMPAVESKPRGALQKKYIPAATVSNQRPKSMQATTTKPAIPTYDSDSDASVSSFQRSRPRPRQNDGGRYTMRASMRSGPAPTMRTAPKVQSINPSEPASPPPSSLRRTMRPSSPPEEPAGGLKYSKFSIRSLSPTGRFRSSKIASEEVPPVSVKTSAPKKQSNKIPTSGKHSKQTAVSTEASKSRFKSRFVDSSDEEDDRPQRFQSRFADSDDEDYELPANLAPVRGIPRKPGEEDGDSTDLDDEASDGEPSPLPVGKDVERSGSSAINGATNGQNGYVQKNKTAAGLPTMEAGKKAKSKRGFFGLGKKKTSVLGSAVSEPDAPLNDIPMPPVHCNREPKQQLTPIDEDKDFEVPVPLAPSRSPKLQRRSQPPRDQADSEQWPLQPTPNIGQVQRPQSSDGAPTRRTSFRPTLSKRHSSHASQNSAMTAETEPVVGAKGQDVSFGRSGKKKKFQGLRRVFGLHD